MMLAPYIQWYILLQNKYLQILLFFLYHSKMEKNKIYNYVTQNLIRNSEILYGL